MGLTRSLQPPESNLTGDADDNPFLFRKWKMLYGLAPTGNPDAPPALSSAVRETLGLEVQSGRGPMDVLIVEHIERPSSN